MSGRERRSASTLKPEVRERPAPQRTGLSVAVGVAVALLLAGLPGSAAQDDAKREQWVAQYHDLQLRHARLTGELEQARKDYRRGRSSKHLRGEGKAALIERIAMLEESLTKVDREVRDFPDTARRAGAMPGWFRDLEEASFESPQPAAAIEASRSRSTESLRERRAAERKRRRRVGRD